ncbi:MAG: hypothetical protein WBZ36_15770 [Candidatus Nitrosopolaris sp.]
MWTPKIYSNNSEYKSMMTVQRLMDRSPVDISSSGDGSSSLASPTKAENLTEIIYGTEAVIETVLNAISLIEESMDIFMDITSISIITSNERLMDAYVKLKDRGVKIRNITEITIDSLPYLKKMMSFAEVRHIDGITGSFVVSERDYISNDTSPTDTISQRAIHSTMKVFVQQHQFLFDTIWKNAIPTEQKIQEIEKGIEHGTSLADIEVFHSQPILGVSSPTLFQLDNKKHGAIMEIINRNVKQYTALRICHSNRWNQEYMNLRMECEPDDIGCRR